MPCPNGSKKDNDELDPGEKDATERVLVENCPGSNWPQWSQPGSLAQNAMGLLRWCFGDLGRQRQKVARAGLQNARFCGHVSILQGVPCGWLLLTSDTVIALKG